MRKKRADTENKGRITPPGSPLPRQKRYARPPLDLHLQGGIPPGVLAFTQNPVRPSLRKPVCPGQQSRKPVPLANIDRVPREGRKNIEDMRKKTEAILLLLAVMAVTATSPFGEGTVSQYLANAACFLVGVPAITGLAVAGDKDNDCKTRPSKKPVHKSQ